MARSLPVAGSGLRLSSEVAGRGAVLHLALLRCGPRQSDVLAVLGSLRKDEPDLAHHDSTR